MKNLNTVKDLTSGELTDFIFNFLRPPGQSKNFELESKVSKQSTIGDAVKMTYSQNN